MTKVHGFIRKLFQHYKVNRENFVKNKKTNNENSAKNKIITSKRPFPIRGW